MPTRRALICGAAATLAGCSLPRPADALAAGGLQPYRSDAELGAALERWRAAARLRQAETRRMAPPATAMALNAAPPPAPAAAKAAEASGAMADSITNVQTAGVDEGGIVKRAGDFLVILRRGRLFSVRVGGDALQPTAAVDAFAPGSDPSGAWYDELLVEGRTVVVIGYSYARGGTEIGLFEIDGGGRIEHRNTYHLRSFDYYSSRNYASRLIGRKLVFYSPTLLQPWGPPPLQMLPGVRRWQNTLPPDFQRILPATRIYRSDDDFDPTEPLALHTVTVCELGDGDLRCESSAVLGPAGRVFYVAAGSVYVWAGGARRRGTPGSAVFRLPLDGGVPSGLKAAGVPIDQMSFLEDGDHLNVLLREAGDGEGMWSSETSGGRLAMLRVPLALFGDGRGAAQREHYRRLPGPDGGVLQNRFVGHWLLWGAAGRNTAWALRFADRSDAAALDAGHGIERIEAMGNDALLVGNDGSDLCFSAVRLSSGNAALAGRHVESGVRQGETRSHGFFYRATGADGGLLGLPLLGEPARRRPGVYTEAQGSASVLMLRQRGLRFVPLGELQAGSAARDDACKASCVDWYGNARPIFLGERLFALLGYELVEGRLAGDGRWERLEERRRVSFAPGARSGGRYSPFG